MRVFDGPHEWVPPGVLDEALGWFRIQAMKSDLVPREIDFITVNIEQQRNALPCSNSWAAGAGLRSTS